MTPSAAVCRVRILGKPLAFGLMNFTCRSGFVVSCGRGVTAQDVQAKNNDGDMPLHWACRYGYHDITAILRGKGAVD
jgi:hypothetical protein